MSQANNNPIDVQSLVAAAGGIKPLAKVIGQADYDGYHRVIAWVELGAVPDKVMKTHGTMLRKMIARHERKQAAKASAPAT